MLKMPCSAPVSAIQTLVEPAGIRAGQQDPADRAEIGRRDEGAEHHQADEALAPACRCARSPRRAARRTARRAARRRRRAERVHQRLQMARAAVGGDVVGEREARRSRAPGSSRSTSRTIGLSTRKTSTAISSSHSDHARVEAARARRGEPRASRDVSLRRSWRPPCRTRGAFPSPLCGEGLGVGVRACDAARMASLAPSSRAR